MPRERRVLIGLDTCISFVVQYFLIVTAPVPFAAALYLSLSIAVRTLKLPQILPISPRKVVGCKNRCPRAVLFIDALAQYSYSSTLQPPALNVSGQAS